MLIIGEKLNSSIPSSLAAMQARDTDALCALIQAQNEAGADYLDLNAALVGGDEVDNLLWLVDLALKNGAKGIVLDSPSPEVLEQALTRAIKARPELGHSEETPRVICNSITLTTAQPGLVEAIAYARAGVVVMPIEGSLLPHSAHGRVALAQKMVQTLTAAGVQPGCIFVDIMAQALATTPNAGVTLLQTLQGMRQIPGVQTVCGLSNISFGLPGRAKLAASALTMLLAGNLSAAILDPTSPAIQQALILSATILGEDDYCMDYIRAFREKAL